jgi:hypothetical protein
MRVKTQIPVPASILRVKRFAILLVAALVWTFGAAACGVQEGRKRLRKRDR